MAASTMSQSPAHKPKPAKSKAHPNKATIALLTRPVRERIFRPRPDRKVPVLDMNEEYPSAVSKNSLPWDFHHDEMNFFLRLRRHLKCQSLLHSRVHGDFRFSLHGVVGLLLDPENGLLIFFPILLWYHRGMCKD